MGLLPLRVIFCREWLWLCQLRTWEHSTGDVQIAALGKGRWCPALLHESLHPWAQRCFGCWHGFTALLQPHGPSTALCQHHVPSLPTKGWGLHVGLPSSKWWLLPPGCLTCSWWPAGGSCAASVNFKANATLWASICGLLSPAPSPR